MVPKIVSATYVSPLSVAITFSDGKEQTSSGSGHVRLESWPLEEIRSGYAGYTVHYTDHAGQEQSIRIEDSFTR